MIRSIPSLLALSIVALIPFSRGSQLSFQSVTGSPVSPLENELLNKIEFYSFSTVRKISLIASVDIHLENFKFLATFIETVDFPTPVAPAIKTSLGGLVFELLFFAMAFNLLCN